MDKLELIFSTIGITRRRVCFMHNSLFPGAEKDRLDLMNFSYIFAMSRYMRFISFNAYSKFEITNE